MVFIEVNHFLTSSGKRFHNPFMDCVKLAIERDKQ